MMVRWAHIPAASNQSERTRPGVQRVFSSERTSWGTALDCAARKPPLPAGWRGGRTLTGQCPIHPSTSGQAVGTAPGFGWTLRRHGPAVGSNPEHLYHVSYSSIGWQRRVRHGVFFVSASCKGSVLNSGTGLSHHETYQHTCARIKRGRVGAIKRKAETLKPAQ